MDPEFVAQMTPYMMTSDNKCIPVTYMAFISDGKHDVTFERTKLAPRPAIERAMQFKGNFEYNLAHAIALPYKQEMLESGTFVCKECGKPATEVLQCPTTNWTEDPPIIQDIAVTTLCGKEDCIRKAQGSVLDLFADMSKLLKTVKETVKEKTGLDVPSVDPEESARICFQCGNVDSEKKLRKCSRCKRTYFCDKECQQKAWKRHKKDCRAPESS